MRSKQFLVAIERAANLAAEMREAGPSRRQAGRSDPNFVRRTMRRWFLRIRLT